jgi:LEA14-like dessication related protein
MKKVSFLLCSLLILFSSCGDFKEVTFSGVESVKMIKLSQNGAEAEITARIKNPNSTSFTVYKSEFDVTLNGLKLGKAHLAKNVKIRKFSEDSYTFDITSDFSNLMITDIPQIIAMAMSKNVKVGLKGNLRAGKLFVKKDFPVDMTQTVPLSLTK